MIVLITAITAGICVLSLYSVYGNVIRHETTLHDLRSRVEVLHNEQILHMAEIKGEIAPESSFTGESDVEIVDEADEDSEPGVDASQFAEELVSSSTNAA